MGSSSVSETTELENVTVSEALDHFDREHRFGKAAYTEPWNTLSILGIKLPFPNPKQRREVVHPPT